MGAVSFDFSIDQVSGNDTPCFSTNHHQIHHFVAVVHFNFSTTNLSVHCRISPEQQLLTGLSLGVKSSGYQYPSKRAIVQQSAVISRKRDSLGHTLVYDIGRYLSQTVYVGFTRSIISPFNGIIEQTIGRIAIALVVFGGIDPALGCNRMGPSGRILKTKRFYIVAQFGQCG